MRPHSSARTSGWPWDSGARTSAVKWRISSCSTTTSPPSSARSRRAAASTRTSRSFSASCSRPTCRRCCSSQVARSSRSRSTFATPPGALLLPLTAAQILWINLMTDGLPALALAFDRTPGVMRQPPRPPGSPLLDRPSVRFVASAGSMKAMLGSRYARRRAVARIRSPVARAVAFHFMAIGQLLLTYPSRHTRVHPLPNRYLHAAVLTGIGIQFAAAWWPLSARFLGNAGIPLVLWFLVFGGALLAWVLAEGMSQLAWRHHAKGLSCRSAPSR